MAKEYTTFNRLITAPTAGYTGDVDPSGSEDIEINDGASEGRAWDMSDYPIPTRTYVISGSCTTNQAATFFDLSLWRKDARDNWEFVQTLSDVASGAMFVFGAVADGTVFVQIEPVDGAGAATPI